ncbi:hypothetical protein I4U23_014768 [Adineta vaga]|nr:hypothetical protein I4U23_014768 [Adineta vaga]
MNKWSRSLPSINVLTDETHFINKPFRLPQKKVLPSIKTLTKVNQVNTSTIHVTPSIATTTDDSDSLTDVSVINPDKPSPVNHERKSKPYNVSNQYDSVIEIDAMIHNEFVPVDQLYDSLFAYANSFHLDDLMYSSDDIKIPVESPSTVKQRSEPSSNRIPTIPANNNNNNNITRYRSCENVFLLNKPTPIIQPPSHECKPAPILPRNQIEPDDDNDNQSDESTTVTDGSKFQWEYFSEPLEQQNKSSKVNITNNYHITAKTKQTNLHCCHESEQRSTTTKCKKAISLSPIIIRERMKDPFSEHTSDPRHIRSSSPRHRTTPIIIREIVHRPSPPTQLMSKHSPPPISFNNYHEYNRSSKPPIAPKYKPTIHPERDTNQPTKDIFMAYNQVNVSVEKNIHQLGEINHIDPTQYIQSHGSALYSSGVFHNMLTKMMK